MGGKSTSNGAVLNSQAKIGGKVFDLRSWQGLTEVLRIGKESLKDPHSYADFRNLVLEYAQKGGEEAVRKKVETILKTFGTEHADTVPVQKSVPVPQAVKVEAKKEAAEEVVEDSPVVTEVETPAVRKLNIVTRRPAPSFIPHAMAETEEVSTSEVVPVEVVAIEPVVESVPESVVAEVVQSASIKTLEPVKITVGSNISIPGLEKGAPRDDSDVKSTPTTHKSMDEHKARISEIKRIVHERVGNPATLIDTHNTTGKKYMVALLTALKATGAGSPVGIENAMVSLEDACASLLSDTAPVEEIDEAVPEKVVIPEAPVIPKQAEPAHPPKRSPADIIAQLAEERAIADAKALEVARANISAKEASEASKPIPVVETPRPAIARVVEVEIPTSPAPMVEKVVPPSPLVRKPFPTQPTQTQAQKIDIVRAVEESLSPHTAIAAEKAVQQSELFTAEVSRALNGLLHEWSLFSGSGILGIGPGGIEHPLYAKLASLSMGEVLAGRWEKSDAKVIRIIKEYVDAWRHEQGIAYTINETFEHYLRRVVQRILKRQQS